MIGLLVLTVAKGAFARLLMAGGALSAAITGGYGVYHTGVERGWFAGPDTCTSGPIDAVSAADLLGQIMAAPLVRCDEVAWSMAGLSMASWNAVASFAFMGLWILALGSRRS